MFSYPVFFKHSHVFWLHFGFHFGDLSVSFASRLRAWICHRFFIDFGMDLDLIFDMFLMNFPFADPPCKTFKFDDPSNEFTCFYNSEKHDC
jgi:hypothetical protein